AAPPRRGGTSSSHSAEVRDNAPRRLDTAQHYVHMHVMHDIATSRLSQNLLDTCMCHKTRMAARAITRAYDDALRKTGLRATQLSVLAAGGSRGALSVHAL